MNQTKEISLLLFYQKIKLKMCSIKNNKTHCSNGHEFKSENIYITPKGYRQCRECRLKNIIVSKIYRGIYFKRKKVA
jgi:hypothetical protein